METCERQENRAFNVVSDDVDNTKNSHMGASIVNNRDNCIQLSFPEDVNGLVGEVGLGNGLSNTGPNSSLGPQLNQKVAQNR